jgi:hypothetical protein
MLRFPFIVPKDFLSMAFSRRGKGGTRRLKLNTNNGMDNIRRKRLFNLGTRLIVDVDGIHGSHMDVESYDGDLITRHVE